MTCHWEELQFMKVVIYSIIYDLTVLVKIYHFLTRNICFPRYHLSTFMSLTHEQNCVGKKKHKHLLDITRALLISSFVPQGFSAKAILTTTTLANITPSFAISNGTPYQCITHPLLTILTFKFLNIHALFYMGY